MHWIWIPPPPLQASQFKSSSIRISKSAHLIDRVLERDEEEIDVVLLGRQHKRRRVAQTAVVLDDQHLKIKDLWIIKRKHQHSPVLFSITLKSSLIQAATRLVVCGQWEECECTKRGRQVLNVSVDSSYYTVSGTDISISMKLSQKLHESIQKRKTEPHSKFQNPTENPWNRKKKHQNLNLRYLIASELSAASHSVEETKVRSTADIVHQIGWPAVNARGEVSKVTRRRNSHPWPRSHWI